MDYAHIRYVVGGSTRNHGISFKQWANMYDTDSNIVVGGRVLQYCENILRNAGIISDKIIGIFEDFVGYRPTKEILFD